MVRSHPPSVVFQIITQVSSEGTKAKTKELNGLYGKLRPVQEAIDNMVRYVEQHAYLPKAMADRLPELEKRRERPEE